MGTVDSLSNLVKGLSPKEKTFHDTAIQVYETEVNISNVTYWKENARTVFDFALLLHNKGVSSLDEIDERDIVDFLYKERKRLKLQQLAESIFHNGIKNPIVLSMDGRLLDGNRRFFACKILEKEGKASQFLTKIPALLIPTDQLDPEKELKILAEANFVDDCKVPWPLDVKAKMVAEHVERLVKVGEDERKAKATVAKLYGIKLQDVKDYMDAKSLADEFIRLGKNKKETLERRDLTSAHFVYFWEFLNKAMKGRDALKEEQIMDAKKEFHRLLLGRQIRNIKQIEAIARSCKVGLSTMLSKVESSSQLTELEIAYREAKAFRDKKMKAESFRMWLIGLRPSDIDKELRGELSQIIAVINKKLGTD